MSAGSGCPKCRGINSQHCDVCQGRSCTGHRKGDVVQFDAGTRVWSGVVQSVRSRIRVIWSDGVIGSFEHRHAHRLVRVR